MDRQPAATSFLHLGSTVRFNVSSVRAPSKGRSRLFCEYDFINSEVPVKPNDGEPHTARDTLAVSHHKRQVVLLSLDTNPFKRRCWYPPVIAARVDEHFGRRTDLERST